MNSAKVSPQKAVTQSRKVVKIQGREFVHSDLHNTSMKTPGTGGQRHSTKMTTGKLRPLESTLDSQNYTEANKMVMNQPSREQANSMASNKKMRALQTTGKRPKNMGARNEDFLPNISENPKDSNYNT